MHEVSLGEAILDAVERRAAGRKVCRVKVRVGTLHAVVGPALDQGWELVSEGTVAQGSALDVVQVDGAELILESLEFEGVEGQTNGG